MLAMVLTCSPIWWTRSLADHLRNREISIRGHDICAAELLESWEGLPRRAFQEGMFIVALSGL